MTFIALGTLTWELINIIHTFAGEDSYVDTHLSKQKKTAIVL